MRIAVANIGPAIYLPIGSHRQSIGINTTKASIPCLYTVEPDIIIHEDTIQHFTLAAMAEERIKRVRNYRKPSLLMHKIDTALYTQMRRNAFFNEERQHMALPRADFFPYNKIKAIVTFCPKIPCPQSAFHYIMIGKRDDIEVSIMLDMMQDLLNSANTVTIGTVHM